MKQQLDSLLEKWNLLRHPFYQAWSAGTLSINALFEIHSAYWHESEKILKAISALSAEEQTQALSACEKMGESLWNALTGVYEKTCFN